MLHEWNITQKFCILINHKFLWISIDGRIDKERDNYRLELTLTFNESRQVFLSMGDGSPTMDIKLDVSPKVFRVLEPFFPGVYDIKGKCFGFLNLFSLELTISKVSLSCFWNFFPGVYHIKGKYLRYLNFCPWGLRYKR